jgi:hypothetical protein
MCVVLRSRPEERADCLVKTTFVGRESELAVLVGLLDDAVRSGSSVAALVTGQPGSGKTRLLDQVLSNYKGTRVVRSAGYEPSKSIPLAAAGHLLRTLAEAPNNGTRLEELAFTGNQPDVYDLLRVFEVAHRSYAEVGPLVLAVDDLQWVDEQTLALIHYMLIAAASSSSPMIVIAAGRPSSAVHAFRAGAEAALTDQRSVALELRSLSLTEGIALVRSIDGELGAAAATEMWRRSQGSPFWLEVLAKGGASDSSTVINDRLRSASGDAGVLLSALAMVGRPSTDEEMSAVLDWPPPRVHHAAGELVAIGLIIGDVGALRIVHDLIREEVVRTIPAPTRHRLHASMASVVEGEAGDDLLTRTTRSSLGHGLRLWTEARGSGPAVGRELRFRTSCGQCPQARDELGRSGGVGAPTSVPLQPIDPSPRADPIPRWLPHASP